MKKFLLSPGAKRIYLILGIALVLFLLLDNVLLPWYVNRGGTIEVPDMSGRRLEDAISTLDSLGLEGIKGDVRLDRTRDSGIVIVQNPLPGHIVKHGRRVYLTISGGEPMVTVPNLRGRTLRDARFALEREGLKLGGVSYAASEQYPTGTLMEQTIIAGAKVKRDVYVSVIISQGPASEDVTVPDLTRKTMKEAQTLITSLGLEVGNITYLPSDELLPNTIIDQFPRSGEVVHKGQPIDLFVVQGGEKKKEVFEY